MNSTLRLATLVALTLGMSAAQVHAQDPAAPVAATQAAAHYSVDKTTIGELLDDANACAVLDKYIPGFTSNEQVDLARGMTLRGIQPYAQDTMTDEVLAKIDSDLGKLSPATAPHGS